MASQFSFLRWSSVVALVWVIGACGDTHGEPTTPPVEITTPKPQPQPQCSTLHEEFPAVDAFDFKLQEEEQSQFSFQTTAVRKATKRAFTTPTKKLKVDEWPNFVDDLNFENMTLAIDRQLKRFGQIDLASRSVTFGGKKFSATAVRDSLKEFKSLVATFVNCAKRKDKALCAEDLNTKLEQKFDVYVPDLQQGDPRFGEADPVLFTAYYTPTLRATTAKSAGNPYAIYKRPPESIAGSSRTEIDFKNIFSGKNLELFYTKSLFDLYLLHVQGGGRAVVTGADGKDKSYYLTYDGTNGQSWTFISKYMIQKGYIRDGSIDAQRKYLERNPGKQEEIFGTCPSYVYFKITNEPPHGSDMVPLTDNRSIATDSGLYGFKGVLSFVEAKRPANPYDPIEACEVGTYKSFSRFYLDQDTGGAIKGKGRVDLYFGENSYAEVAAYNTVQRGNLYFLMLK